MSKKKLNQEEIENGIGEDIDLDASEVEDADHEMFFGFAQETENEVDDEELIAEYERCKAECENENHKH
jgi:hypothetical protein